MEARPNARWSLDFIHDQFACGRRFRVLNIVDDVTRECLAAIPDTSISGRRVARELTDTGMSLIIEGAFHADTANQFFAGINTNENTAIQVSVVCDFDVARARFEKRIKNQERHSVHTDSVFEELSQDELLHKYRPLGLEGVKTITYDTTTNYGEYKQLLKTIRTLANN